MEGPLCEEPELYPDAKTTDCMIHLCQVSSKGESLETESSSAVAYSWEWELGQGVTASGSRDIWGLVGMVFNWIVGVAAQLSKFMKNHCTVHFRWEDFML